MICMQTDAPQPQSCSVGSKEASLGTCLLVCMYNNVWKNELVEPKFRELSLSGAVTRDAQSVSVLSSGSAPRRTRTYRGCLSQALKFMGVNKGITSSVRIVIIK